MNAWTGHAIASAILTHSMSNREAKFLMGCFTVFLGLIGIVLELADRIERKKNDHAVSGAPR